MGREISTKAMGLFGFLVPILVSWLWTSLLIFSVTYWGWQHIKSARTGHNSTSAPECLVGWPTALNCRSGSVPAHDRRREQAQGTVVRATESLFLENMALKLVLEHRVVPNCKSYWRDSCRTRDAAGVRLRFRHPHDAIEQSANPSNALEALLGDLPAPKKSH